MTWLNRLEHKFGHLAIPGLLRIVAGLNALCFILVQVQPQFLDFLWLDPGRVLQGQVWRLFTFVFIPVFSRAGWLWEIFLVWWLFFLGDALETVWGAFKLNIYYLLGVAGTAIASLAFGISLDSSFLNASLVFAVANFYPDMEIRLMMVLPVKMKWLAWITGAFILFNFMRADWSYRLATIVGLANYLLFFGREIIEHAKHRRTVAVRRAKFERDMRQDGGETMHRCKICGRTELVSPDLEFRVAADGEEYCLDDLPKANQ